MSKCKAHKCKKEADEGSAYCEGHAHYCVKIRGSGKNYILQEQAISIKKRLDDLAYQRELRAIG